MQNSRGIRGSKRSKAVSLERILVQIARVRAHLCSFSSNSSANVTKRDRFSSSGSVKRWWSESSTLATIRC